MTSEHSSPRPVNPMTLLGQDQDALVQAHADDAELQQPDRRRLTGTNARPADCIFACKDGFGVARVGPTW